MKTITVLLITFVSAGTQAKGILEFAYGYHFCNCIAADSAAMKNSGEITVKPDAGNELFINASPNPAKTWVAFDYKLPLFAKEAVLQIMDVTGKTIANFSLKAKQGQQVWDIRDIEKGVYPYTLKTGSLSKSGKLIIK